MFKIKVYVGGFLNQ